MRIFLSICMAGLIILFSSCDKSDFKSHQQKLENERNLRLSYIEEHNIPESAKKDEGIYFIELKEGTGGNPESGDWVLFYFVGYDLEGRIFSSNMLRGRYEPLIVEFFHNENSNYAVGYIVSQGSRSGRTIVSGLAHALKYMKKGGRARVLIPSILGYGIVGTGGVLPYTSIIYEIEVSEIRKR